MSFDIVHVSSTRPRVRYRFSKFIYSADQTTSNLSFPISKI